MLAIVIIAIITARTLLPSDIILIRPIMHHHVVSSASPSRLKQISNWLYNKYFDFSLVHPYCISSAVVCISTNAT